MAEFVHEVTPWENAVANPPGCVGSRSITMSAPWKWVGDPLLEVERLGPRDGSSSLSPSARRVSRNASCDSHAKTMSAEPVENRD